MAPVVLETPAALLTVTQVSEKLGVDRKKVFRALKRGQVTCQRIGWLFLVPEDQLEPLAKILRITGQGDGRTG